MQFPFRFRRRSDPFLIVVDAASALLVAWLAFVVIDPKGSSDRYRAAGVGLAVSWVLLGRANGLYRRDALRLGTSNLLQALRAAALVAVALLIADYTALKGDLSLVWVASVVVALVGAGVLTRAALRRTRRALVPLGVALERYAVLGDHAEAQHIAELIGRTPYVVVTTLPPDLPPAELMARMRAEHIDGLVVSPARSELAGRLSVEFTGTGVDVQVARRRRTR